CDRPEPFWTVKSSQVTVLAFGIATNGGKVKVEVCTLPVRDESLFPLMSNGFGLPTSTLPMLAFVDVRPSTHLNVVLLPPLKMMRPLPGLNTEPVLKTRLPPRTITAASSSITLDEVDDSIEKSPAIERSATPGLELKVR